MISTELEKKEAVKVIKTLNNVLASGIVSRNALYEGRINKVRSGIRAELGAYLARKELGEDKNK